MFQDSLLAPRAPWMPDALRLLARHRFLTSRLVAVRLAVPEPTVRDGFTALVAEGALRELRPTTLATRDTDASAYALTARGLALLDTDDEGLRPRTTRSLTSAFSLAHELLLNEFALVLERLDAARRLTLLSWTTARERIADVAHLAEKGKPLRVPLVADGLAVVEHHGAKLAVVVEVDMNTVSAATMRRKYTGYHAWWQDGGPTRRHGVAATRVLTIAPGPRRLARLRTLAIEGLGGRGSGLLWFLPHDVVDVATPERLFDDVATVARAGDDAPRPLFAP